MTQQMATYIADKLQRLPDSPGVYLMKNADGKIIYIGKAKNLFNRVSSYFEFINQKDFKTHSLIQEIADFDIIITNTETEALLAERSLIKFHSPRYNVLLRDDKQYPYLRINYNETWPRLEKVRQMKDDNAFYLGPFSNVGFMESTLRAIHRIFPLIKCSRYEFEHVKRPCSYYHMKMCLAPCHLPVDRNDYLNMLKHAVSLLQGRSHELAIELKKQMHEASEHQQYELAATYRDQLHALEFISKRQSVVVKQIKDADVFGIFKKQQKTSAHVLMVRDGKLIGSENFLLNSPIQDERETLQEFLLQYYSNRYVPQELIMPFPIDDQENLTAAISSNNQNDPALINIPKKGNRKDLIDMAYENAKYQFDETQTLTQRHSIELELLKETLKLDKAPDRIECIDISNIGGTAIVASNVCFINGRPAKEHYRHYNIKTVSGTGDDFTSIREVVMRRIERGLQEDNLPDLLVIDGGRGQLNAALDTLASFKSLKLNCVALAKARTDYQEGILQAAEHASFSARQHERVFFPDQGQPLLLKVGSPEYRILTSVRDEAHRFAIAHHRKKRLKHAMHSELEDIPGIGTILRQRLLQTFHSLDQIKRASIEELQQVKGVNQKLAVLIHSKFRE